jgi:hypothetical protein
LWHHVSAQKALDFGVFQIFDFQVSAVQPVMKVKNALKIIKH